MKKPSVIIVMAFLLIAQMIMVIPVLAATNNFIANGNIIVSGVTFDSTTVSMYIVDGSTAESWTFDNGAFTVTNPGTFQVGSSNSSVKTIKATIDNNVMATVSNSSPGTSYLTLPTTAGTYTIVPSSYDSGGGSTGGGGGGGSVTPETPVVKKPTVSEPTTKTVVTPTTVSEIPGVPAIDATGKVTLAQIAADAQIAASGDVNKVIAAMGVARNATTETSVNETIVAKIVAGANITAQARNTITNFVAYGTKATKVLGAGERAGVVNSYRAAFGKLPTLESEWSDVIKIANGRWPSVKSNTTEASAATAFAKIYLKQPDRTNPHDDAAVTVIAYGLRPANRNLNSEKAAIKIFKGIYGYQPTSANAWDIVRAIAYSGATR